MLLHINNTITSGIYSVITNTIQANFYKNIINGKEITLNSNIINNNSFILDIKAFNNTQYLLNNYLTNNYNTTHNFSAEIKGGGNFIINNKFNIVYNFENNIGYTWSSLFCPIKKLNNLSIFQWTDLTSYSKILTSGSIDISLLSSLNYTNNTNKVLFITDKSLNTNTNISILNINSFNGTILINDIINNNIVRKIDRLSLNNINFSNISINTLYINIILNLKLVASNLYINIFNPINTVYIKQNISIKNSNIYYFINKFNDYFYFNKIYNSNIYSYNSDFSVSLLNNNYDISDYNFTAFINKNSNLVIHCLYDINISFYNEKYGNELYLKDRTLSYRTKNEYNLNNNSKFTLAAHAHIVKIDNNDNLSTLLDENNNATIFPIQTISKNITHHLTDNTNMLNILNKTTYLPLNASINTTYIPENSGLPIGSIICWCQVKNNSEWLPNVPDGFYLLTNTSSTVLVDADNPRSKTYNALLAVLYGYNSNKIILPAMPVILYNNNLSRLVYILKYSDNWNYIE